MAEIVTAAVGVGGWTLVTAAIAQLVRPDVVWLASAGLFLLSIFGWGFLYQVARKGMYALTRGGSR